MKKRMHDKQAVIGSMHGTERSSFASTAEAERHTNRAGSFVGFGRYTYLDKFPARGREGSSSAGSTGYSPITHSSI